MSAFSIKRNTIFIFAFILALCSIFHSTEKLALGAQEDDVKRRLDAHWDTIVKKSMDTIYNRLIEMQLNYHEMSTLLASVGNAIEGLRKINSNTSDDDTYIAIINFYAHDAAIVVITEMSKDALTCQADKKFDDLLLVASVFNNDFRKVDHALRTKASQDKRFALRYITVFDKIKPYIVEGYLNHPNRRTCGQR